MMIHPVGANLFDVDGYADKLDSANSCFTHLWLRLIESAVLYSIYLYMTS